MCVSNFKRICGGGWGESIPNCILNQLFERFFATSSDLVTHWPVNSQAAVDLTTAMFASGNSGAIAELLRMAELAMIAKGGDYADPARWAPFTVYGRP